MANRTEKRWRHKWKLVGGARSETLVRFHIQLTKTLAVGLLFSVLLVLPFLQGWPLHRFWRTWGNLFGTLCVLLWTATAAEAGIAFVYWYVIRRIYKAEKSYFERVHGTGAPTANAVPPNDHKS